MSEPRRFMAHDAAAAKRRADLELVLQALAFVFLIALVVAFASVA